MRVFSWEIKSIELLFSFFLCASHLWNWPANKFSSDLLADLFYWDLWEKYSEKCGLLLRFFCVSFWGKTLLVIINPMKWTLGWHFISQNGTLLKNIWGIKLSVAINVIFPKTFFFFMECTVAVVWINWFIHFIAGKDEINKMEYYFHFIFFS